MYVMTTPDGDIRQPQTLSGRVAARVRLLMSAQQKTNADLATLLHVSVRQAIRLKNGEQELRFADLDIIAPWLGLSDAGVLVSGDAEALMAAVG